MEWIMNRQHIKPVKNKSKDDILGELEDKEELYNLTNLNKIKIKKNQLDDINQLVDYLQDESDDKAPLKSSKTILDKIIKLSGLKLPQSDRKEIAKNLKKTVMHANRIIGKAEK